MIAAEDRDDADLAERITESIQLDRLASLYEHDPNGIRLQLVYHAYFGDRAVGVALAKSITAWPDRQLTFGDSLRCLSNAGICLIHAGELEHASHALNRARSLCPSQSALLTSLTAYHGMLARHTGGDVEAFVGALHKEPLEELDAMPLYLLIRDALDRVDLVVAERTLAVITSRFVVQSKGAYWAEYNALKFRLSVLRGTQVDHSMLAELAEWSTRTAPRRPEDDVALAVSQALECRSPSASARFVEDYFQVRRAGLPILPILKDLHMRLSVSVNSNPAPCLDAR